MKKVLKWIVVVLFGLYVVSQVMEFIDEQQREAKQKEKTSNFDPTKSISYKVVQNAMKAATEQIEDGDGEEGESPVKRNPDEMPADARKLAMWLCVPYIEEDCVPRMGVTYKDTETGYFKYRFYITGGKDGSDFGQAQLHIHLRTRGLVTQALKPLGHGIYQLNREDTGELDGWLFTDHDGQRIIVVDASNETEYTIVDEELEADDDTTPAPKFQG